jgi:hypothetical protein
MVSKNDRYVFELIGEVRKLCLISRKTVKKDIIETGIEKVDNTRQLLTSLTWKYIH